MDLFLNVAGVIGFVASQDSLINLFNRVGSLLNADSDYSYETCRFESCKQRFHTTLSVGRVVEGDLAPRLCIAAVKNKLEEISRLMIHAQDVRGRVMHARDKINKALDEIDKLIGDLCALREEDQGNSSTAVLLEAERKKMKLLASLLRVQNKQPLRIKELRELGLYVEADQDRTLCSALGGGHDHLQEANEPVRFISWRDKSYIVDRVGFGSTAKDMERKLSRLGRLIINMREWEDPCVAKMALIAESQNGLCILSEVGSSYRPLEDALVQLGSGCNSNICQLLAGPHEKISLLIEIASAIKTLHDQMILHEGIGGHNVLVSDSTSCKSLLPEVKLAGFVSARMVDDWSDRPYSSSEQTKAERRRQIYQSPWRIAGSRYSFECDVYSLGVLMAELQCGASFVHDSSIVGRDHILAALEGSSGIQQPAIAVLTQECMSAEASTVPPISEVLERLRRMLP